MLRKAWLVLIILSLLVLVMPACGGDSEDDTTTATAPPTGITTTATPVSTSSPTTSASPVKIGAITSWSGAAALSGISYGDPTIKTVEWQVKQQGGILGGRELKVVKYDNRASVADGVAGARKLMIDEKVSALVWGGVSATEYAAISEFAEENHILFVIFGGQKVEDPKYTLCGTVAEQALMKKMSDLCIEVLHSQKVAIIAIEMEDGHSRSSKLKQAIEPAGIKVVYEQYVPIDVMGDMSAYVTQIRSKDPDFLYVDAGTSEFFLNVMKAYQDQGGWGDMKVAALGAAEQAKTRSGAEGVYIDTMWVPGLNNPGSIKLEQDYAEVNGGKTPATMIVYYYNCLWTAIHAIELSGTDTDLEKIAYTARFSGKLEWDSPMGHAHYTAESGGYAQLEPIMAQVVNKQLVIVPMPE